MEQSREQAEIRVDWKVDQWGNRTPLFKKAPLPDNFTYSFDMLSHAAHLYMQSGERVLPSIEETLYKDLSWENQVKLYVEGLKWARDIQEVADV